MPSLISKSYAPAGKSLISVTTLTDAPQEQIIDQLEKWFGAEVTTWSHLKTYPINYALPAQAPPALTPVTKPAITNTTHNVFVCGDYLDTASINGAMASGRRAAGILLAQ